MSKIKIEEGMELPRKYAESMEELQSEYEGITLILDTLLQRAGGNRAKMRYLWEQINEEFDLDGKIWKASYSPKTDLGWVFEGREHHGLDWTQVKK